MKTQRASVLSKLVAELGYRTQAVESIFFIYMFFVSEEKLYLNFCKTETMAPFAPIFFLKKVQHNTLYTGCITVYALYTVTYK